MSDSVRDRVRERSESIRMLEENFWSMWSNFGKGPGCHFYDRGDAMWFDTPMSTLPYNTVMRFSGSRNVPERVESIISHYSKRKVPFTWIVHPTSPRGLTAELERRGLKEIEIVDGMIMDLEELPDPGPETPGFDMREVLGEEDARQVMEMIASRWKAEDDAVMHLYAIGDHFGVGTPDAAVRLWAAYQDGTMVSKTVLHCAAGAAGVYGVATRPEYRRKGLAAQLVLRSLAEAKRQGHTCAILHSSDLAVKLYRRMGFRSVSPFIVYATDDLEV